MVQKFDEHGLRQIGQILELPVAVYYYIFTISLLLFISERTMEASFADTKKKISKKLRNSENE